MNDNGNGTYVQMFCPNCGTKVMGFKRADGGVRISCPRCSIKIFSKQKNSREVDIKLKLN